MKKFEPLYRLVRFGLGTKIEKASRQQRTFISFASSDTVAFPSRHVLWLCQDESAASVCLNHLLGGSTNDDPNNRQAAQEPPEDATRHSKGQGCQGEEGEISASPTSQSTSARSVTLCIPMEKRYCVGGGAGFLGGGCFSVVFGFCYERIQKKVKAMKQGAMDQTHIRNGFWWLMMYYGLDARGDGGILVSQWGPSPAVPPAPCCFAFPWRGPRAGDDGWDGNGHECRRNSLEPGTGAEGGLFNEGLDFFSRSCLHHLA